MLLVGLLSGVLAAWSRHAVGGDAVILIATCLVGGYGVALSSVGLVPALGYRYLPGYTFFVVFALASLAGVLVQTCIVRPASRAGSRRDDDEMADAGGREVQTAYLRHRTK